jgi:hypothetical protein
MKLLKQLKKYNSTLYQINEFILNAKKLGYGEIELIIKTHNYVNKIVEMKAVKPKKKKLPKSITKRVMVAEKKKCTTCIPKPGKTIRVDDIKKPRCPVCGKDLFKRKDLFEKSYGRL